MRLSSTFYHESRKKFLKKRPRKKVPGRRVGSIDKNWKIVKFSSVNFPNILLTENVFSGGVRNLERKNVERPILRNFEIANIKITKAENNELFFIF